MRTQEFSTWIVWFPYVRWLKENSLTFLLHPPWRCLLPAVTGGNKGAIWRLSKDVQRDNLSAALNPFRQNVIPVCT
jgi:hypothetical protein